MEPTKLVILYADRFASRREKGPRALSRIVSSIEECLENGSEHVAFVSAYGVFFGTGNRCPEGKRCPMG